MRLSLNIFEPGAAGIPSTATPIPAPPFEGVEFSHANELGCEALRASFAARSLDEAVAWLNRLMASVVVYSPDADPCWEGFLSDVEVEWGSKRAAVSLADMANSIRVRYTSPDGQQATTAPITSAASIARFGTKERVINFGTATAAEATARATVVLNQIAWPRSKQGSTAGTGQGGDGVTISLTFRGWSDTLSWLMTANTTEATAETSTQVASLLAAYNATNAFFSTSSANITATGVNATQYIEPDTTYAEAIAKLLASGNSAGQRVVWGIYEGRALTVVPWAGASPATVAYFESDRDQVIRDAYGNRIEPWDLRPNVMAQLVDMVEPAAMAGPVDTLTRRYIKRTSCSVSADQVRGSLEPDDVDSLEELLTRPTGNGPTGTSARQAAVERITTRAVSSVFPRLDNPTRYDGTLGVWKPIAGGTGYPNTGIIDLGGGSIEDGVIDLGPGGSINLPTGTIDTGNGTVVLDPDNGVITFPGGGGSIDTGGGTITNPGGGDIDLGTGTGIGGGGSTAVTIAGSGTPGALTKWAGASSLTDATAGTDYASASHNHAAGDITSGTMATARLGSGTASISTYLRGDSTWATVAGGIDGSGTGGQLAKWSDADTLTNAVAGTDYAAASHNHAAGDITSGTMATARLGSGTASSTTFLRGDQTWQALSTITPADISAAPSDAKYIVQTASSGLSAEQALGALATGLLKNTTTTGVLSIATAADLPAHASRHEDGGADELALDASQITTGTMATARLGSGTASSSTFLRGDQTWQALTTITPAVIGAAPDDAKYIVQTASSGLSAEQALGSLATGILKNTTTTGVLSIAVAGTDYAAASHNHAAADITSGTMATARLGSGTASSSTFLRGDQTWQAITTITPATIGAAPDDATYIVKTASSGLSAEFALGSLATGLLKNTTTTGNLSIAVAGTDYAAASHNHAASDITSGTMATARLGSGTASSSTYLRGDSTWATISAGVSGSGTVGRIAEWDTTSALQASTLAKTGAGVLTLSASGSFTLTVPATGTAVLGSTTTAGRVAFWSGANTISHSGNLLFDSVNGDFTANGDVLVGGELTANSGIRSGTLANAAGDGEITSSGIIKAGTYMRTTADNSWDFGTFGATTITPTGRISIGINGTTYYVAARPA